MKYLIFVVVLVLGAVAYLLPVPDEPEFGMPAGVSEPPVAVCAIEEGSGRTTEVSVLSTVDGRARLTLFASGQPAGNIAISTGPSGSVTIPVVDIAAVGTVGALLEMPTSSSAASAVVRGAESLSAESCQGAPEAETFITGASTTTGRTFVLHLMNPYAGEAIVDLVVQSEAGIETNERLSSVVVPSRSSSFVDLTDLIPGRESLSISVETIVGRVIALGRQGIDGDGAVWNAVPAGQDWLIPVPQTAGSRRLVIATPSAATVDYQVDIYSSEGLEEAYESGALGPRGQRVLDLSEITGDGLGLRVVSTGPVVATMWIETDEGLAVTTGSAIQANRWFLPGASVPDGGWATVVVLNAGLEDAEIGIRPLRATSVVRTVSLEPAATLELGIEVADGYMVEATGPVVVLWSAQRGGASSLALGVPLEDG